MLSFMGRQKSLTSTSVAPGGFSKVIYAENGREQCLKAPPMRGKPSKLRFRCHLWKNVIYGVSRAVEMALPMVCRANGSSIAPERII